MFRLLLAATLLLSACASKKLSRSAELVSTSSNAALEVSAEVVNEYTDAYNVVMQINFESKDGQWIRVDKAELDLTNNEGIAQNIIIGKDLNAWLQAKADEKKIREVNEDIASLGLVSAGAVLLGIGAGKGDASFTTAGAVATAGGGSVLLKKEYRRAMEQAQQAQWVPDTHLYSPFTIPSMSLVKRWVLINTPSGRVNRNAVLKIKTVEGDTFVYNIVLARK
jgi:hypothetical protein